MLESEQLKQIFKSAIVELLRENSSEVSALLSEIIEDIAMEKAIAEGENTEIVSRESIFGLLERKSWKLNSEGVLEKIWAKFGMGIAWQN